jgi:Carboxypeptidase regulatory-like domain/Kelch motif
MSFRARVGKRPTSALIAAFVLTVLAAILSPAVASATPMSSITPAATPAAPTSPVAGKTTSPTGAGAHPGKQLCGQVVKAGYLNCLSLMRTDVAHTSGVQPHVTPAGFGPADLDSAYDLPSASAGGGATVGIVDAFDYPGAESDLAVYRAQYGLPACTTANGCFKRVDQRGGTDYPAPDAGWQGEMALDVDMVSAICPNCHIVLVEADDNFTDNLGAAVDEAVALGAKFVSNSYGGPEDPSDPQTEAADYDHPGVAVTASTGDESYGVSFPAASPHVTAVGGTSLFKDSSARGWSESAWSGAGSGCSAYEPKPAAQTDTGCSKRTVADVSAVADLDTGVAVYVQGGWNVFGGTSVSSPIIASTFALGGTPVAGTYPNNYPYAATSALNDVTSGSNGSCTPAYLCTGGPGYDGPTGLGTPEGVAAFRSGPTGYVSGATTDGTGAPLAGVAVTAGDRSTISDSAGHYSLAVPVGTYTVAATKFGYQSASVSGIAIADGQTVTEDFTLTAVPDVTVSGLVRDASGHGWPVYAQVEVAGQPTTAVYTDPATGHYSLTVPSGATYSVEVDPVYSGYVASTQQVTVAASNVGQDIPVQVDTTTCSALGYAYTYSGATQAFDGSTLPAGWTVQDAAGNGQAWAVADPGNRGNLTGGSGGFAMIDSDHYGSGNAQDTTLLSPVEDLSRSTTPTIQFASDYDGFTGQTGDVDYTTDGGTTWTTVWHHTSDSVRGPSTQSVALTGAAGQKSVQVRFHFTSSWGYWWELDNVFIGDRSCSPTPGGLVTGHVYDQNTGAGINGAVVTSTAKPADSGITRSLADPATGDGFFWLFSSLTGAHPFTAAASNYGTVSKSITVVPDWTTDVSYTLGAGKLTVTPATIAKTVAWQGQASQVLKVTNTGTAPVDFTVNPQTGGFTPQGQAQGQAQAKGPTLQTIKGDYTAGPLVGPHAAKRLATKALPVNPFAAPWQTVANYPTAVMDNGVATVNGKIYSITGIDGTNLLAKNYVYDPTSQAWSSIADIPTPRENPEVAAIGTRIYVFGGWGTTGDPVTTTAVYDTANDTWSTAAAEPEPYAAAGVAVLGGKVYIVGGCSTSSCGTTDVEVFDPTGDTWAAGPALPAANAWMSCGAITTTLYCAGGNTDTAATKAGYSLGTSGAWAPIADLPETLWASGTTVAGGQLLVSGGVGNGVLTNAGFTYDPTANAWTALPNSNNTVYRGGSACGLYKVGGSIGQFSATNDVELLPGYDQCVGPVDVPWMKVTPTSGTVAPGKTVQVTVALDASVASIQQPGTYTAGLTISAATPYPTVSVPVSLTVKPPATWGKISGTVTGTSCTGTAAPVAGATVQIDTWAQSFTLKTDASGNYQLWLDTRNNPLTLIVAKDGWQPQTVQKKLVRGQTTSADFVLKPGQC